MNLASALGLDNEVMFLKSRGFPVCEARTVGGPEGKFRVGHSFMDAAEVRAIANRLADRFPDNPYLPRKAAPEIRGQQQAAPKCSARLQLTPEPKEIVVSDRLRGMNEVDVRSDMGTVAKEHGSQAAAARALGLDKNRWNNTRAGYVRIGDEIMLALYGPEGTTLRAEIRKQMATGEVSANAPPPVTPDVIRGLAEPSPAVEPEDWEIDSTIAGPYDAPAQGWQAPPPPEPALQICTPEERVRPELSASDAPCSGRTLPAWLTTTLEKLIDEELKIGEQVAQLTAQRAKIAKARELLREIAA